jgi:hypothetical protein
LTADVVFRATILGMKVVILYRPDSEHARAVDTFVHDFKVRNSDTHIELEDVDGREGSAMASLYDIMQYPAILVLSNDGSLLKMWVGDELPLIDEVASYAYSGQ